MRKSLTILALAIITAGIVSCGRKPVTFAPVTYSNAVSLEEGSADSITISVNVEYPDTDTDKRSENITGAITEALFGDACTGMKPEDAIKAWADSLVSEYRESNLEILDMLRKNGDKGPHMSMNWGFDKSGKQTGIYRDILGYTVVSYSFTGGAHGGMSEFHLNFDLSTGKLLKQEDVFADGFEKQTGKLLMKHLNDGRSPEEEISLLTDTIEPNGNFSIGENGVTFTYNQYEIAAYSFGIIDILIPADEIRPYLKTGMNLYDD